MLCAATTRHTSACAPCTRSILARSGHRPAVSLRRYEPAKRQCVLLRAAVETTAAEIGAADAAPQDTSSSATGSKKPKAPAPAPNVLFARNLARGRAQPPGDEFEALVRQYSGVQDVCLTRKGESGYYFGYITFDTEENAQAAKEKLHDTEFNGLRMAVVVHERDRPLESSSRKTRGRGPTVHAFDVRAGNLAWATTDAELKEHFKGCDGLKDAFIVLNREGRPSGHGYVRFETEEQAAAAVKDMRDSMLDGRVITLRAMPPGRIDNPADTAEDGAGGSSSSNSNTRSASSAAQDSDVVQQQQQRRQQRRAGTAAFSIRAGNLAWATTGDDLKEHFKDCPGARDAWIVLNKEGRPAGAGYLTFDTEQQAAEAVEALQGSILDGREIKLTIGRAARSEKTQVDETSSSSGDSSNNAESLTQTRVVVKNLPPSFTWREVFGMCSVFGEVSRVLMLTQARNKRSKEAAVEDVSNTEASSEDVAQSGGEKKLVPAALADMVDRAAAERAVEGLNGLQVQGRSLRVNIYRGSREKAHTSAAMDGDAVVAAEGSSEAAAVEGSSEAAAVEGSSEAAAAEDSNEAAAAEEVQQG